MIQTGEREKYKFTIWKKKTTETLEKQEKEREDATAASSSSPVLLLGLTQLQIYFKLCVSSIKFSSYQTTSSSISIPLPFPFFDPQISAWSRATRYRLISFMFWFLGFPKG